MLSWNKLAKRAVVKYQEVSVNASTNSINIVESSENVTKFNNKNLNWVKVYIINYFQNSSKRGKKDSSKFDKL